MSPSQILARFPLLEVMVRHFYWRVPLVADIAGKLRRKPTNPPPARGDLLAELSTALRDLGIVSGDVLIVHSAMRRFFKAGHSAEAVFEVLRDAVGPEGTLVMPAFTILEQEPPPRARFDDSRYAAPFTYRKGKEPIWTGAMPVLVTTLAGARLSSLPLNTVVAVGPHAGAIVDAPRPEPGVTPCGPGSPWAACLQISAKILMLDVDVAHSLTMIHVAEDLFEDEWPIRNWYRNRDFRVIDDGVEFAISMRERHPKWALFYCEKMFNRDLFANGVFRHHETASGLSVDVASAVGLTTFLRSKRPSTYPYTIPFSIGKRRK